MFFRRLAVRKIPLDPPFSKGEARIVELYLPIPATARRSITYFTKNGHT